MEVVQMRCNALHQKDKNKFQYLVDDQWLDISQISKNIKQVNDYRLWIKEQKNQHKTIKWKEGDLIYYLKKETTTNPEHNTINNLQMANDSLQKINHNLQKQLKVQNDRAQEWKDKTFEVQQIYKEIRQELQKYVQNWQQELKVSCDTIQQSQQTIVNLQEENKEIQEQQKQLTDYLKEYVGIQKQYIEEDKKWAKRMQKYQNDLLTKKVKNDHHKDQQSDSISQQSIAQQQKELAAILAFRKQANSIVFDLQLKDGSNQQMTSDEMKKNYPLKLIEFYESKIRMTTNKKSRENQEPGQNIDDSANTQQVDSNNEQQVDQSKDQQENQNIDQQGQQKELGYQNDQPPAIDEHCDLLRMNNTINSEQRNQYADILDKLQKIKQMLDSDV